MNYQHHAPRHSARESTSDGVQAFRPAHAVKQTQPSRLTALSGLRLLACVCVVLYHFGMVVSTALFPHLSRLLHGAPMCLEMFFILSGFVLGFNYLDRPQNLQRFYIARFARVLPMYFLALLLTLPSLLLQAKHTGVFPSILAGLLTPTLLQSLIPSVSMLWNYPAWSVSVEVIFYVLFPFACRWFRKKDSKSCLLWIAAFWLLTLAPAILYCLTNPDHLQTLSTAAHHNNEQLDYSGWLGLLLHSPAFHFCEFLTGVALSRVFLLTSEAVKMRWCERLFSIAVAGLLGLAYVSGSLPYPLVHNGLGMPLIAMLLFGSAGGAGWGVRLLGSRLLAMLGDASYAIYILQYPVFIIFKTVALGLFAGHALGGFTFTQPAALIGYLILTVGLSVVLTKYAEPIFIHRTRQLAEQFVARWSSYRTSKSHAMVNQQSMEVAQ